MKTLIYSIWDKKTQLYMPPFIAVNQGDAVREMMNLITKENKISKFPEDYDLIEIGQFNDSSGMIHGYQEKRFICNMKTLQDEIFQKREQNQLRLFQSRDESQGKEQETEKEIKEQKVNE